MDGDGGLHEKVICEVLRKMSTLLLVPVRTCDEIYDSHLLAAWEERITPLQICNRITFLNISQPKQYVNNRKISFHFHCFVPVVKVFCFMICLKERAKDISATNQAISCGKTERSGLLVLSKRQEKNQQRFRFSKSKTSKSHHTPRKYWQNVPTCRKRHHAMKKYWQKRDCRQVFTTNGDLAIFHLASCKSYARNTVVQISEFQVMMIAIQELSINECRTVRPKQNPNMLTVNIVNIAHSGCTYASPNGFVNALLHKNFVQNCQKLALTFHTVQSNKKDLPELNIKRNNSALVGEDKKQNLPHEKYCVAKTGDVDYSSTEVHENYFQEFSSLDSKLLSPPSGDIHREIFRLSTFATFPIEIRINASQYAQAGFYYLGIADHIKCFACDNINQNLTPQMDPFLLRMHKSSCRFTRREDSCGNVPIHPAPTLSQSTRQPSAGEILMGRSLTNSVPTLVSNQGAMTPTVSIPTTPVDPAASQAPPHAPPTIPVMRHLANIIVPEHEQLLRQLDLRSEVDRIRSFTSSWPRDSLPSARRMANAGWFYLGNLDRTQCFSCGGVLRNWRRMDNPAVEHVTHFPNCAMAQGREPLNIPEGPEEQPLPIPVRSLTAEERVNLQEMFPCHHPASAQMSTVGSRIATFVNWLYTRATPRMLAEAGFYSLGVRDRVKCYYCGGGLQNWRRNDDPWEQHAKWYPQCEFLLQSRGIEYVHQVVARFPDIDRPVLRASGLDVAPSTSSSNQQQSTAQVQQPQTPLDEAMVSEIATTIIGMGYEERIVRQLMQTHIRQHGSPYTSASSLLDDVMNFDDSNAQEQGSSDPVPPAESAPGFEPSTMQMGDVEAGEEIYRSEEDVDTHDSVPTPGAFRSTDLAPESGDLEAAESHEREESEVDESARLRRRLDQLTSERLCKVCLDRRADMVFIPCKHICCCMECTRALRVCPICRVRIERGIRTYAN